MLNFPFKQLVKFREFVKRLCKGNHNVKNENKEDSAIVKKNYEDGRLEQQLKWHSRKAAANKFRYRLCQIIIMIISAVIPLVNLLTNLDIETRIVSSLLGAVILVVTGISQLEKYHENWIIYRTTQELLKKEKYFFENDVAEYANLDEKAKRKLLVERVENLVSSETNKYFTNHQFQKTQAEVKNQKTANS
jgi:Protein of unknown function (DUF4231)